MFISEYILISSDLLEKYEGASETSPEEKINKKKKKKERFKILTFKQVWYSSNCVNSEEEVSSTAHHSYTPAEENSPVRYTTKTAAQYCPE